MIEEKLSKTVESSGTFKICTKQEILIRGETKNPILDNIMVTITHVDISPDLRNAKFYLVPIETDKTDVILKH